MLSGVQELKEKCHPLGVFDNMERLAVAANMSELYDLVLRDTPLGGYFSASLSSEDLDEMNLEILRNTLYKAYLDDFAKFCAECGGATADIMGEMMQFEVRSSTSYSDPPTLIAPAFLARLNRSQGNKRVPSIHCLLAINCADCTRKRPL